MEILKTIYDLVRGTAEPIAIDEIPSGVDSLEANMVRNIYGDALDKGLFGEDEENRLKTIFRNLRVRHGDELFSEERIEATIKTIKKACGEFAEDLRRTDHARTRAIVAKTPEIWR